MTLDWSLKANNQCINRFNPIQSQRVTWGRATEWGLWYEQERSKKPMIWWIYEDVNRLRFLMLWEASTREFVLKSICSWKDDFGIELAEWFMFGWQLFFILQKFLVHSRRYCKDVDLTKDPPPTNSFWYLVRFCQLGRRNMIIICGRFGNSSDIFAQTDARARTHTRTHAYAHSYTREHIYIHTLIHTRTHIHTHTHARTPSTLTSSQKRTLYIFPNVAWIFDMWRDKLF